MNNVAPNVLLGNARIGIALLLGVMGSPNAWAEEPSDSMLHLPELPKIRAFEFVEEERKILEGSSGADRAGTPGVIGEADRIGELAAVARFYQNGTYTDGNFNHKGFPVMKGKVRRLAGEVGWAAYQAFPPQHRAAKFLGSRHMVCFRFAERADHIVYALEDGRLRIVAKILAARIKPDGFTALPELDLSAVERPVTWVFARASEDVAVFARLGAGVEGGVLLETEEFRVVQVNVAVKGRPYDTAGGFPHGPDSHENIYGQVRRFFSFLHPERGLGVVWQDTRDQSIQLNWLGKEFSAPTQHPLANPGQQTLVAAAMDAGGFVYYFTVRSGTSGDGAGQRASLYKVDAEGKLLKTVGLDASAGGLDIKGFTRNSGSMAITGDRLGLIFSRTMFNGHQGAISLVFDTATLKQLKHHGQTSGHSFDSVLGVDAGGKFLGMDLGDNYPRGLHLHRFDEAGRRSALVYTFKTEHASEPKLIGGKKSAVYPEISRGGQTFYKWSNDNETYTELGGIAECEAGIAVVFAGEASHEGRALDNERSLGRHFDPRNLGLVLVRKDFEAVPGEKGKAIPHGRILSQGKAESGGFYDFGGGWQALNNEGVVWLTDYKDRDRENASRVKLARLGDDSLIVFWEEWTPESYLRTRMVRVSSKGERLSEPMDLGSGLRLGRREDPVVDGNRVLLVSGSAVASQIQVHVIEWRKPLIEKTKIDEGK